MSPAAIEEPVDINSTNDVLSTYDPEDIVGWASRKFDNQLVMSSSFGAESALLIHIAIQTQPGIKIIFIDTGFLFPETHRFMEMLRRRFDLNVWTYRTNNDPIAYLKTANEIDPTIRRDIEACCAANKNEPFDRAMSELKPAAWLRGIRRHQTGIRAARRIVEYSRRYDCFAISPLLNWSSREIHAYMKRHDLPYHPLYERGYASIGCNPMSCTRPIQLGEDPRSGRWAGTSKLECGLHLEGDGSGI